MQSQLRVTPKCIDMGKHKAGLALGAKRPATSAAGGSGNASAIAAALKWLNSYPKVSSWMKQYDIEAMLDAGGGLCRITDFFPPHIADGALALLESIPAADWNKTEATQVRQLLYVQINVPQDDRPSSRAVQLQEECKAAGSLLSRHSMQASRPFSIIHHVKGDLMFVNIAGIHGQQHKPRVLVHETSQPAGGVDTSHRPAAARGTFGFWFL